MTKLGGMANDQRRRITKPPLLCPDYQRSIPVDSRAAHSFVRAWPVAETTGNRYVNTIRLEEAAEPRCRLWFLSALAHTDAST
jgi:hypothetical protein